MKIISRLFIYVLLLSISACASSSTKQAETSVKSTIVAKEKPTMTPKKEPIMIKPAQSWQQVTVKHFTLEGGFYGLISAKGMKLLPMNLPKKYRIEGTILSVKGDIINDMVIIQQWGQPFEISDIKLVKMGDGNKLTH